MKKLMIVLCAVVACHAMFAAQDAKDAKAVKPATAIAQKQEKAAIWPVPFEFLGMEDIDVVGFRFTIPWQVKAENVTGFDIGFWGKCRYFEGLQCSIFRNDVTDSLAGIQVGFYNSVGTVDIVGIQAGLWNEAHSFSGIQAGLVNVTETASGVQVGLINRADSLYGFQIGVINVIRENQIRFMPVVNIGFDTFTDPKF